MSLSPRLTVGFVGFGKMASAMWEAFVAANLVVPQQALFYSPTQETQKKVSLAYGLVSVSLETLVQKSDILFFCMKPQQLYSVLEHFPPLSEDRTQIVVSILAGVPISTFEAHFGPTISCVRVMPNMPSRIGEGVLGVCYNSVVTLPYRALLQELFQSCGLTVEVLESQMNVLTGISGSGPAFFYQLCEDLCREGRTLGMSEDLLKKLYAQTLIGAGRMILESDQSPKQLKDSVVSEKGTTAAGLAQYEVEHWGERYLNILRKTIMRASELSGS